jgi:hypothetical protein
MNSLRKIANSVSIKIWVTFMHSQFYRLILRNFDVDIFCEIETGSGSLTKYYSMALSVPQGNFVIKQLYNQASINFSYKKNKF